MKREDLSNTAVVEALDGQPEEVRGLLIYAMCQTMAQSGMLELVGVSGDHVIGTTLIYRNPDTSEVFEIPKPDLSEDEEREMNDHIKRLISTHAG